MPSPLATFKRDFAKAVAESQGLSSDLVAKIEQSLEKPREEGRGDLALPCFALAKEAGEKNPAATAEKIARGLSQDPRWAKVEAVKAFVNVTFATSAVAQAVVPRAREQAYGSSDRDRGKTVTIDFSSPNIAKPLAFHHIRSTVIGAAIGRIHRALGWEVRGINYLGDWGKQFGLLATGFQRHGEPAKRTDAKHLVEVYVTANKDADVAGLKEKIAAPAEARRLISDLERTRASFADAKDEKEKKPLEKAAARFEKKLREMRGLSEGDVLADAGEWLGELEFTKVEAEAKLPTAEENDRAARMFLKRMEEKDPEALATWQEYRQTSVADFQKVYARMGILFESIEGESLYQDVLEQTIAKVREKPGTRMSEGAEVVDLPQEGNEPPIILKTRDGTTLYVTRDIAAAMHRHARFAFARSLYVVAADQALHFRQLFKTLKAMGFDWADKCKHVEFGRIHGMSTRRGNVIFLDEVLEDAVAKARDKCESSEKDKVDPSRLAETAEAIGIGAIVFRDLKALRTTDYTFSWDDVLDFSGESGPYVQFSHARCCSILKKAGGVPESADLSLLTMEEERPILMTLSRWPEVIEKACDEIEPSIVTRAILELAKATASYLTAGNRDRSKRVLVEDNDAIRAARLHLIDAVRNTLAHGLGLLGVRAPEAM
jgi:arginyl-tRNA synthetase